MKRGSKQAVNDPIFPSFTERQNKGGVKQPAVRSLRRLPLTAVITAD